MQPRLLSLSRSKVFWDKVKLTFFISLIVVPLYSFVQNITSGYSVVRDYLLIDSLIPFIPQFAYIYASFIFLAPLAIFILEDYKECKEIGVSIVISVLISCTVFLLFPTSYPRPETNLSGVTGLLLNIIHWVDMPNNTFPSVHVSVSFCSALGIWRLRRGYWVGAVAGVWACLIAISTVFVKQHYVLDVIGGVFVALVSLLLARKLVRGI